MTDRRYQRRPSGATSSAEMNRGRSPRRNENRPLCPQYIFDPKYQTTYTIHQCLGKGGFAYVYRATSDSETFAIKVISLSKIQSPSYGDKIQREIDIHKRLQHSNIVSLFSTFQDEFNVYLLLDYCPYGTLLDYINSRPHNRLSESHSVVFLKQILKAVRYLHSECKILHRDIKPGNVLLSSSMTAKLADFGFACSITEERKTQQHSLCGTPNYLAPEVINRKGHSVATEAWAIGCTFYCMIYGKPPFESDHLQKTYDMIKRCAFYLPEYVIVSERSKDMITRVLIDNASKRLSISDMLRHDLFLTLNRSSSYGSSLNSQLEHVSRSCQNLLSPSAIHSRSPRSLSRISSRVNVDSGLGNDASSSFSRGLGKTLEKYIRYIDLLLEDISVGSNNRILVDVSDDNSIPDLFIVKWVDYTNRYGFGCTLKNGIRTTLFLDDSSVSASPDGKLFAFWQRKTSDDCVLFSRRSVAMSLLEMIEKIDKMRHYMDLNLHGTVSVDEDRSDISPDLVHIVAFRKFTHGIFMLLSDGTCQINMSGYVKLVFRSFMESILVTVSHNGHHTTFVLQHNTESVPPRHPTTIQITDYASALVAASDVFRDFCREGSTGNLAPILSTAC